MNGTTPEISPATRGPGRPKGSRTKERAATIAAIMKRGDPLQRLAHIMRGKPIPGPHDAETGKPTKVIPTPEQQLDAAKTLAAKVMPNLRTAEVTIEGAQQTLHEWLETIET